MTHYRYCPMCAGALERRIEEDEERLVCTRCGFVFYQNSKPTAGVLIVRDGKVLLAKRRYDPRKGRWDIVGGFLRKGEPPEAGALREVREETALEVRLTRLIGMYVDTYSPDDTSPDADAILNIYYEAEVVSGIPDATDDVEELRWFDIDALPDDWAFTHQPRLIADWRRLRDSR